MLKVKIVNLSNYPLPQYATAGSAGMDLRADIEHPITLQRRDRITIPTGIRIGLPIGYEGQVRPRSGLAINHGIGMINAPGTIDSDYRGEIHVNLVNLGNEAYTINPGDRIAQLIVSKYEQVLWDETDELDETKRGSGKFGHTGIK